MIVRNDNLQEVSLTQLPDYEVLYNGVFPGLLDLAPSAEGAWSLRKLKNSYTGPTIRVRRSSDNTEQDFGFDGNGELDLVSISAFCSGTDGYLTTWYDQSGNSRHATQSLTNFQYKIINNGSIYTKNGKPCIDTQNEISDPSLTGLMAYYLPNTITCKNVICVGTPEETGIGYFMWDSVMGGGGWLNANTVPGAFGLYDGTNYGALDTGEDLGAQNINWGQLKSSKLFLARNGEAEADKGTFANTMTVASIVGRNWPNGGPNNYAYFQIDGSIQELVLWNLDNTSKKADIEKNINDYWQVY